MNKKERINKAIEMLRFKGIFKSQKQLANILRKPEGNISRALKGDEKYLTNGFVTCFAEHFSDIIDKEWLLTGEGEMLAQPTATQSNEGNNNNNVVGDNNNVGNTYNNTYAHAHAREHIDTNVVNDDVKPIIPKYLASQPNTDVYKVIRAGQVSNLTTLRTLPPYKDFDFYYQVRQDAMQPIYMQGDVLALAHVADGSDIIQGAAMVIDTADYGFLLRRLYDRGDAYECRRVNENSAFENQIVKKDKVIRLYRVVYSLRLGD